MIVKHAVLIASWLLLTAAATGAVVASGVENKINSSIASAMDSDNASMSHKVETLNARSDELLKKQKLILEHVKQLGDGTK